ncbi:HNH endonuclease [Corallococcus sp. BB11-1]|uniref:HNH endonuclease n=1 Tax=Corallococcus sp. BB11-1 TaxID=2996783 RepID=UPI0010DA3713|nr:HNH endonuclease [Corallococcus sp. BB11-1]MCY1033677.1 HNH endonuclease [Corallococcus sp. BB11-1]RYZ46797.1 MAG: HNH endonuclease [Myxococcaceae bacterium]
MINSAVLVLNRYYQPVHVTSVKRAFSLLYQGVAKAIDAEYRLYEFADWAALSATQDSITTIDRTIRVPRVLVLGAYDHLPRAKVRFSRLNIYARDNDTCQYCSKQLPRSELNLDHVNPRTQGGKTTWENVVCSCVPCNLRKGGRTPEQAGMRLLKKPVRPRWTPLFRGAIRKVTYREWLPFLHLADISYWNVELLDE